MALEVVGGAFLSAVFNVLLEKIASPEIKTFFQARKLNDNQLNKLKIKLFSVHGVLEDAEGKQFRNAAVKEWLDELKDAAFVADDLFDEIYTEAKMTANEVHNFNLASLKSWDKELEHKIEQILGRLEFLVEVKEVLRLKDGVSSKWSSKTPTTSLVEESCVYGRDKDKEAIIDLLLLEDLNDKKISVIPIVGMGGIGKTTLAQLVYNDERVKENFELMAWACVSEEFDVVRVTKVILEAITSCSSHTNELNPLQVDLKMILSGKKFLIVLDDVWNENYHEWCHLRSPFQHGAQGSKIIVTTRNLSVASLMQTVQPHLLENLSDEDCWNLFAKHAFEYQESSNPILEEIGRKLVKKCNGLPLAAKTLGGLLRTKTDVQEWGNVLKSDIWDITGGESNIIPALILSYYYLPSHLKQCFAYCSIFPNGYEFQKSQLILLWMAENLIQPIGNKRTEEIGDEYFHELVSRSFFQPSRSLDKTLYVMHDLINGLAQFISRKFCIRLESEHADEKLEGRSRYLSIVLGDKYDCVNCENFRKASHLRTLWRLGDWRYQRKEVKLDKMLLNLRCLRVLSLAHFEGLEELPGSIGFLRHLRYLDVSETQIKWFPETICTLYNLQSLKAVKCSYLQQLPHGLQNLINLRYLDILGCSKLKGMPPNMSKLTSLQKLSIFIVGKENGCSIREIGQLVDLRGKLCIQNLQHVRDVEDAKEAKLNNKDHLQQLILDWSMFYSEPSEIDSSRHEKDVLDNLRPNSKNLEMLVIYHYMGTEFPSWLGSPSFHNLVSLELINCKYCCVLPPLGQLPSLKHLRIHNFKGVVTVADEFCGDLSLATNAYKPFPSLESVMFSSMPTWEEWSHVVGNDNYKAFPCLQRLGIRFCPRLTRGLPPHLPFLKRLSIFKCPNLEFPVNSDADKCYQFLESLQIYHSCDSLRFFHLNNFPNLKDLSIIYCVNLESLTVSVPEEERERSAEHFSAFLSLKVSIWDCPNFISMPPLNFSSSMIKNCEKFPTKS